MGNLPLVNAMDVVFNNCFALFQTTEGLGIMIIEGAHTILGKGIFISDIQKNSLAFKVRFCFMVQWN